MGVGDVPRRGHSDVPRLISSVDKPRLGDPPKEPSGRRSTSEVGPGVGRASRPRVPGLRAGVFGRLLPPPTPVSGNRTLTPALRGPTFTFRTTDSAQDHPGLLERVKVPEPILRGRPPESEGSILPEISADDSPVTPLVPVGGVHGSSSTGPAVPYGPFPAPRPLRSRPP